MVLNNSSCVVCAILFLPSLVRSNTRYLYAPTFENSTYNETVTPIGCSKSSLNLGQIVKGLLKDYDSQMLPQRQTVETVVEIHIQEVSSISELTSDFEMDIMYSEIWKDQRMSFENHPDMNCVENITLEKGLRGKLWTPDTCIVNSKSSMIHKSPSENVFVILYRDGRIWANFRMKVRGPCRLDMTMFPFDLIKCHLFFESYSFNSDEVRLIWHDVPVTFMDVVDLPEFHVVGWRKDRKQLAYPNGVWDRLELTIVFKRRFGAYLVQAYFPTTITIMSAWVGLLLDARTISARTTLGISSLLAMILQFGHLLRQLPRVSYIKCLDVWMIACVMCIFVALVELTLVYQLSQREKAAEMANQVIGQWLKMTRKKRAAKGIKGVFAKDSKVSGVRAETKEDETANGGWKPRISQQANGYVAIETTRLLGCKDAECEWNYLLNMERRRWDRRLASYVRQQWSRFKSWSVGMWRLLRDIKLTATNLDRLAMVGFPFLFMVFNCCYWGYYVPRIEDGSNMALLDPVYVEE